jgi:hypothetical protein
MKTLLTIISAVCFTTTERLSQEVLQVTLTIAKHRGEFLNTELHDVYESRKVIPPFLSWNSQQKAYIITNFL